MNAMQDIEPQPAGPLSPTLLEKMHAYWRAANYLSVGQIYLKDNALLEEPLKLEHIKPRLLGHWGTTPGLNLLYVHLNRLIKENDLNMMYVIGPGHGGPGIVANTYLEGSYTERYPAVERSKNGLQRLFRQFSWPYGIPSHVSPETPGSIHEGGELGYSLLHAYGAVFDNPDLIVACVVGDGEAETGALAASWHSNKFINPARDGAVLPILHLNGFKIANPTVLARISREELTDLMRGYGYEPHFVEGTDPALVHQALAGTLDKILAEIRQIQKVARAGEGMVTRPRWPMIVLRTLKGWTGPKFVDDLPVEGTWRAHQVPIANFKKPEHLKQLEDWMRSYRPEELFDDCGKFREEYAELAPTGHRRMGFNAHANGGELLQPLSMPHFHDYAVAVANPGTVRAEATRVLGTFLRDVMEFNFGAKNFRLFGPGRNGIEPAGRCLRGQRQGMDGGYRHQRHGSQSDRTRHGSAKRASLRRLAGRLSADRAAWLFFLLRSLHPHHRFHVQPACEMAEGGKGHRLAQANCLA
jgi:xylulose-5-phosphate/fructose-6-phosphate phosphoketolase